MDSFGGPPPEMPKPSTSAAPSNENYTEENVDVLNNNSMNLSTSLSNGFTPSLSSSFGPIRNLSSLRAHRSTLYSRPNCVGSMNGTYMSNRYFGSTSLNSGAGRSVVLGTRRVSENLAGPELTSTAQRIVSTLQKVATPVVNKEKVTMDSIKSLRPDLSSSNTLKRKEPGSGPPILRNALEISPQNSFIPPAKAPRMRTRFTVDQDDIEPNNSSMEPSAADISDEYDFPDPWSSEDIAAGVRHMDKTSIDVESLLNYYKKIGNLVQTTLSAGTGAAMPANHTSLTNSFPLAPGTADDKAHGNKIQPTSMPNTQESKWECPSCMVFCKMSDNSCVCCGEPNPGIKNMPQAKPISTPTSDDKWECPICMVFSKISDDACVCCGELNPNKRPKSDTKTGLEGSRQLQDVNASSTFKFGFGTGTSKQSQENSTDASFKFLFGTGAKQTNKQSQENNTDSSFKFGFGTGAQPNKQSQENNTDSSFKFGFGTGAQPNKQSLENNTEQTQNVSSQTKYFTAFGVVDDDEIKAAATIKVQPLSGFRFGLSPAKPAVVTDNSATPKAPEKTWRCNICKDESNLMTQLQCRGCEALRPNLEEPKSVILDTGSGSMKKDFSFAPCFGLKDEKSNEAVSQPQPFISQLTTPFSLSSPTPITTATAPITIQSAVPQISTDPAPTPTPAPISLNTSSPTEKVSPGEKRRIETFVYEPSEPKLKTRTMPASEVGTVSPRSEIKTGSFLDALKKQTEDRPDGGSTISPSSFWLQNKSSTPAGTPATTVVSNTSTLPSTKPFSFQFASPTTTSAPSTQPLAPVSIFGSSTPALPSSTSASFGTTTTPSFSFGSQKPTPLTASASAPTLGAPPAVFQFGQPPAAVSNTAPSSGGLFMFGQGNSAPAPQANGGFAPGFGPTPTFPAANLFGQTSTNSTAFGVGGLSAPSGAPAFNPNFGAAAAPPAFGMQPQQSLFNLGSSGTGERKIKKAIRRMK